MKHLLYRSLWLLLVVCVAAPNTADAVRAKDVAQLQLNEASNCTFVTGLKMQQSNGSLKRLMKELRKTIARMGADTFILESPSGEPSHVTVSVYNCDGNQQADPYVPFRKNAPFELAKMYAGSPRLNDRMRAVPIFEDLVSQGHTKATVHYARLSLDGYFGESTDEVALKNELLLAELYPEDWNYITEKIETFKSATSDFSIAKDVYENGFPYCEQPGKYSGSLAEKDSYLALIFLNTCLKRYSFLRDAKQRLGAISRLEQLSCAVTPQTDKVCMGLGYDLLATGNLEAASKEELFAAAAAASSIYDAHLQTLRPLSVSIGRKDQGTVRKHVYETIMEAQREVDQKQFQPALESIDALIDSAKTDDKFSDYEAANALNMKAFILYQLERNEEAISVYESLLELGAAIPDDLFWQTRKTLMLLYTLSEKTQRAIKLFAEIVAEAPSQVELIPREVIAAAKALAD